MSRLPSSQAVPVATFRSRSPQRTLAALAVAVGLLVSGCGSASYVRGSRHSEMTAPIVAGIGVAVFQGGLPPALAEELARELDRRLGERGLRITVAVVPPKKEAGEDALSRLFKAHQAVLVVGPRGPSRKGQGSLTFFIEVMQMFSTPTPEHPEGVTLRTSWQGEGETPPADSPEGVIPTFASTIVAKLVADRVIR
jgi:hypothetical protein